MTDLSFDPFPVPLITGILVIFLTYYFYIRDDSATSKLWHQVKHITPLLLDRKKKYSVVLVEKKALTHDTFQYRFSLGNNKLRLGLPVGKCLKVFTPNLAHIQQSNEWNPHQASAVKDFSDMNKDGSWKEEIERKYTPTSLENELGYFNFTIKTYRANVSNIFPNGGKMSQYFESLRIGDCLKISGPYGKLEYLGRGEWKGSGKKFGRKTRIGLLAGGSGVTPMLQVIQAVLQDPKDETTISLLYANKMIDDIIVKKQLDAWSRESNGKFVVEYTLDDPPVGWTGRTGFITAEMIKNTLPPPSEETLVLMCGPPPMIQYACLNNLEINGYDMKNGVGEF